MSQTALRRSPRSRGFTLVELMTSLVVMVLVIMAVGATFVGVQQTYQLQAQVRSAVEGGRTATSYVTQSVRLAGYGLEPRFAFDFATAVLPGTTKDNYNDGTGIATDDLAFRYRDPAFLVRGSLASTTMPAALNLDVATPFPVGIKANQALLIACSGALSAFMVQTTAAVAAGATAVNVDAYGAPYTPALFGTPNGCMLGTGGNAPFVMLVHEERIRIVTLGAAPNQRPFLVVFHNHQAPLPLVNLDFDVIAADVETFQLAYVMNRPITGGPFVATLPVDNGSANPPNPNWVLGDEGSLAAHVIPNVAAAAPTFDTSYDAADRYNNHPSNIRAVRATVVVRSSRRLGNGNQRGTLRYNVENFNTGAVIADGFYRTSSIATIRVPNLLARAFFTPVLTSATGDSELNDWGS